MFQSVGAGARGMRRAPRSPPRSSSLHNRPSGTPPPRGSAGFSSKGGGAGGKPADRHLFFSPPLVPQSMLQEELDGCEKGLEGFSLDSGFGLSSLSSDSGAISGSYGSTPNLCKAPFERQGSWCGSRALDGGRAGPAGSVAAAPAAAAATTASAAATAAATAATAALAAVQSSSSSAGSDRGGRRQGLPLPGSKGTECVPPSFCDLVQRSTRFVTSVPATEVLHKIEDIVLDNPHPMPYPFRNVPQRVAVSWTQYKLDVLRGGILICTVQVYLMHAGLYMVEFKRGQLDIFQFKRFYEDLREKLSALVKQDESLQVGGGRRGEGETGREGAWGGGVGCGCS
jgi:hypothetical protein